MAKTEQTLELEQKIWQGTHKQGVFCCFEVTIGWYGDQRVDYMTYDTKGIFRCYEIKVSKSDFRSKAHNSFLGHFNYYVMPKELYEQVKNEIPAHIGVYIGDCCIKRAKRQGLKADEQVLKDSLIRSLYREVEKHIRSNSPHVVDSLNRQINEHKRKAEQYYNKYWDLLREVQEKYGTRWNKEPYAN
jgi:hypothetical protein